jgi:hypothetical protein
MPQLRRLALRQTVQTTSLVYAIVDSPALATLASLSLRDGELTDAIVDLLAVRRTRIAHLRELDLGGNQLSPEAVAKLATLTGVTAGVQTPSRAGVASPLTAAAVLARARDPKVAAAVRALAKPERWLALGRDGERIWGEVEGSDHYYVSAWVPGRRTGCSCPSPEHPCKHALALLLIAAQHPIPERATPGDVIRHTNSKASWRDRD